MRLIDAEEFERRMCGVYEEYMWDVLADMPSAQPERKTGKWIYYPKVSVSVTSTAGHFYPVCSECGCEHPIANYCPNCGARMRGEDDAEVH